MTLLNPDTLLQLSFLLDFLQLKNKLTKSVRILEKILKTSRQVLESARSSKNWLI